MPPNSESWVGRRLNDASYIMSHVDIVPYPFEPVYYLQLGTIVNKRPDGYEPSYAIDLAHYFLKSDLWSRYGRREIFGPGDNKCNVFVYEILHAAGANISLIG